MQRKINDTVICLRTVKTSPDDFSKFLFLFLYEEQNKQH